MKSLGEHRRTARDGGSRILANCDCDISSRGDENNFLGRFARHLFVMSRSEKREPVENVPND
jgi:hypothetical protein